jgi:hypothetical protein
MRPEAEIALGVRCRYQRLQFDRFDLADEAAFVAAEERRHHVKHSVAEAAEVQDVVALTKCSWMVRRNMASTV